MPGCSPSIQSTIYSSIEHMSNPADEVGCSHGRAISYYTQSIYKNASFTAFKCANLQSYNNGLCASCANNNCAAFGYYVDKTKPTGTYYLSTLDKAPYIGDQYLFKLHVAKSSNKTSGEIFIDLDGKTKISLTNNMNFEIKPDVEITRMFALPTSHTNSDVKIYFKRFKSFLSYMFTDTNAAEFSFDKIKFIHFGNNTLVGYYFIFLLRFI